MQQRLCRSLILPLALALALPASAAAPPATWDGLSHVKSKKVQEVYLLPGADFRVYTKVIIDPPEIAFRKDWQREHGPASDPAQSISNSQVRDILEQAKTGFHTVFVDAYQKAGYQVVTQAGPDVLRISTAVVNLDVVAPDTMSAGMEWTFSKDAGGGTLVVEARDSATNALLGRAVDARVMEDMRPYLRNRASNYEDFRNLFERWAKLSAEGLNQLKQSSPINPGAAPRK
ncbi:DUF3313 family protein [Novosphingobium sp. BL-8H]|uniref:DUF3313 family protein n=1 Tax=Novosphingobium sp. BL-8H TaxID=3127640 RepID=UPI003756C3AE